MKRRHFLGTLAAALAACGFIGAAQAQTVAELAAYSGPDREQKLLAGAKKEGTLEMYTSAQSDDMGALVKGFEAKYPGIRKVLDEFYQKRAKHTVEAMIESLKKRGG